MSIKLSERVAELEARIKKLEENLEKFDSKLRDDRIQMQYQLTKDAKLARELGKKK